MLLKVVKLSLRIYCLLTNVVTMCLILKIKGLFSFLVPVQIWDYLL